MWRLIKVLLALLVLGCIGLIVFAYVGPMLGVDFSAHPETVVQPVTLDGS